MGKLNIMHIRDSSGIYGAERVILTLAKHLDAKRFKFFLLCLKDKSCSATPLIEKAQEMGISQEVINVNRRLDITAIQTMRQVLKSKSVDVLHTHDFKATLYGMLASVNLGIKRVATAHGSIRDSFKIKASLFLEEQIIGRFFDQVIAVGEDIFHQLKEKGFKEESLCVIQNGIDVELLNSGSDSPCPPETLLPQNGSKVFGVIARLFPDKGHFYFLKAFARLKQEHQKVKALIVGNGSLKEEIASHIRRLNLEESVLLCGARADMKNVYNQIDCIVIPSLREGLPYVLLEALASKIPVVASAVGDIPQLIRHEVTGYLVPPANVDELQKYMARIVTQPEIAAKMAEVGYDLVCERYSAEHMVRNTERVYESLFS